MTTRRPTAVGDEQLPAAARHDDQREPDDRRRERDGRHVHADLRRSDDGADRLPAVNTEIEAALEALSNIDDVAVTGTGTRTVNFRANQQQKDVPQMTADASGLTGARRRRSRSPPSQPGGFYQAPFNDARRGSTNTNDLRGKLLRIKVKDGDISAPSRTRSAARTTCPPATCSPSGRRRRGPRSTRWASGTRSGSRSTRTAWPTSPTTRPTRRARPACARPQGTGRIEIVRKPSNYGWPMCYKTDLPMYQWDFNTADDIG